MTAPLGNTAGGTPFATGVDAFVYPQFIGYAMRAPTTQDIYNPGTRWQDNSVNPRVIYQTSGAGVWNITTSGGVGTFTSLTVTPGPVALTGTTTINTTGAAATSIGTGGTGPVNIGNATGNTAVTGSLTASTTLTATLGDITATNGNFVSSASGKGLLLNSPATSGASPGPIVVNGRSGQATFTGVSIAAAADLTLTITNSAITGSSTQVIYSMSGSTTGSAPSIKSVTNSAGSSVIVVTNGTGATTTTANIVMNFLVLN